MTPEEIIHRVMGYVDNSQQAIEAINQFAREICNKQKQECANAARLCYIDEEEMVDRDSITTAPYPKELQ